MMFGTDYPLSNDPAEVMRSSVEFVRTAALDIGDHDKIFFENAVRLFGLDRLIEAASGPSGHGNHAAHHCSGHHVHQTAHR
jgi:hypothetical protein